MSPFSSILVPLDGSATAARSLGCATWLAKRLGARLHILSATEQVIPPREELERLRVPEEHWSQIMLHQASVFPEKAVLDTVRQVGAQMLVMTARGEAADTADAEADLFKLLGHVTRWIIEHSPVPVLVLPPSYREQLPWSTALVPISGEVEADEALSVAVRLANGLGMKVRVAHVLGGAAGGAGLTAEARYADAPHHEYPSQLQELISRALPNCSVEECSCIEDVSLYRGETETELLQLIDEERPDLLVSGWHGNFVRGHALLLKKLLSEITCPILLVRASPPKPFRLKVGEEIE
jgi:nucleotide-binding universal stress UspA family protein